MLEVFKIKGKDKQGHKILCIIRKFFSRIYFFRFFLIYMFFFCFNFGFEFWIKKGRILRVDVLIKYLEEKIFARLEMKKF